MLIMLILTSVKISKCVPFTKLQYFFLRDRGLEEEGEVKKTIFAFLLCLKAMHFTCFILCNLPQSHSWASFPSSL